MTEATLDIINKLGLHARAASKLTAVCSRFNCNIVFSKNTQTANGKSIMALMLLAAGQGAQLHVVCEGEDETAALVAIQTLFANRFDESE